MSKKNETVEHLFKITSNETHSNCYPAGPLNETMYEIKAHTFRRRALISKYLIISAWLITREFPCWCDLALKYS